MDMLEKMIESMNKQKSDLVRQKLIDKGYAEIVEQMDKGIQLRFAKINVSTHNDWEYYFADNGTVQGDFIVAVKWEVKHDYNIHNIHKAASSIQLLWQDTDFEPVRIFEPDKILVENV